MKPTNLALSHTFTLFLCSLHAYAVDKDLDFASNWSGFYAGLNAGMVKNTMNITDIQATTFNATLQEVTNPEFTGGLQAGWRHPMDLMKTTGLYGIEFSANFADAQYNQQYGSPFAMYEFNSENKLKNTYLLELIGGIVADKTLLFLAAGLSWNSMSGSITTLDSVPFFTTVETKPKSFGTAFGGGIEYALNNKFSARFKVDVLSPNSRKVNDDAGDVFGISDTIVQGTLGINYKIA